MKLQQIYKNSILIHLVIWVLLFTIPYLLSYDNPNVIFRMLEHSWLSLLLYGVMFYTNYFYLIEKFLFKKKNLIFFISNIIMVIVLAFVMFEIKSFFHHGFEKLDIKDGNEVFKFRPPPRKMFMYVDVLTLLIPIIFAYTLKIVSKLKKAESKKAETETVKLESELKYLKSQLQPHFFFNTINNIYSLIDIDPDDAKVALHKLSKLMRYLLYNTSENMVLLKDEVDFLTNYIELMKLRVGDNVNVKMDLHLTNNSIKIAPMLLLSIVENCFKHGIDAIKPSYISIKLVIKDKNIVLKTINPYFNHELSHSSENKGIGLGNLKQRLALIYPGNYTLVAEQKEGIFYSELTILDYDKKN